MAVLCAQWGVWGAGWSVGMVEAVPGAKERRREVMLAFGDLLTDVPAQSRGAR